MTTSHSITRYMFSVAAYDVHGVHGTPTRVLPFLDAPSISHPECSNETLHIRILVHINRKNDRNIYFLSVSSAQSQSNCLQPFYLFIFSSPSLMTSLAPQRAIPQQQDKQKKRGHKYTIRSVRDSGAQQLNYRVVKSYFKGCV